MEFSRKHDIESIVNTSGTITETHRITSLYLPVQCILALVVLPTWHTFTHTPAILRKENNIKWCFIYSVTLKILHL